MDEITKMLYWVSTGLLVPVIVLLLIFFIKAMLLIGSFYSMYMRKIKLDKTVLPIFEKLDHENVHEMPSQLVIESKLLFTLYIKKIFQGKKTPVHYDKLLNDFEIHCQKDIAGSQTLAKLGPILGLMGTLIPMGPALVGLAAGDIESMASNMQVAFATTVIGLLVGAVGFIIMQVKRRWFASDISNLEFLVELLKQSIHLKNKEMNTNETTLEKKITPLLP